MPYIPSNPDDEEERRRSGTPQEIAGTSGEGLDGSGGGQGFQSPQQSGVSGWTDVSAYLDANKDQAVGMANTVAGRLSGEADALEGQIKQGGDEFRSNVDKSRVDLDDDFVSGALNDPTSFVKEEPNVERFSKMRDASYSGPMDLGGTDQFGTLQAKVHEGKNRAGLVNTSGGRETLLTESGKNPTKGQVKLDSLLLSGSPETLGILKGGVSKFGTMEDFLNKQNAEAGSYATVVKNTNAATSKAVKDRLAAKTGEFQSSLDTNLGSAKTRAKQIADATKSQIETGGGLTTEEREALGLTNWDDILKTRGYLGDRTPFGDTRVPYERKPDLLKYISEQNPDAAFTRENVATPEDYAREAALQRLSAGSFDALPDDSTMAGTAPKNLLSLQGDPLGDLNRELGEVDSAFVDQYKDFTLGGGTEGDWRSILRDPKVAEGYQRMVDIYARNEDKLDPKQKQVGDALRQMLLDAKSTPADSFTEGPTDDNRLRVIDGVQSWWDGTTWVAAPAETRRNPATGQKERFNYSTGQYEPTSDDDGVLRAF